MDTNVIVKNAVTGVKQEVDIVLKNANIQVKSGRANKVGQQVANTISADPAKVAIGFGPKFGPQAIRNINTVGGVGTTDLQKLIEVVAP